MDTVYRKPSQRLCWQPRLGFGLGFGLEFGIRFGLALRLRGFFFYNRVYIYGHRIQKTCAGSHV
jgi:hypothetical protein